MRKCAVTKETFRYHLG